MKVFNIRKKNKYRLKPIIIGYRCEGYELQKSYNLFGYDFWFAVKGENGKIRLLASDVKSLDKIEKDLKELAEHLSNVKEFHFYL